MALEPWRQSGLWWSRARYAFHVDSSVPSTPPTAEKPGISDAERAERLKLLAERLRKPDGLDREALARIEQLSGNER